MTQPDSRMTQIDHLSFASLMSVRTIKYIGSNKNPDALVATTVSDEGKTCVLIILHNIVLRA